MWNVLLSIRYFLSKRKQGIISFINLTSVIGVALGVASLIIVLSVMNGFDAEVKDKIIGTYAHLMIFREGDIEDAAAVESAARTIPEVRGAAPFVTGQAILRKDKSVVGVLLKGVDVKKEGLVTDVISFIDNGREALREGGIVLGSELMNIMGLKEGDTVELIVPYSMLDLEKSKLTVTGSFSSGRYDYDSNAAVVDIKMAQSMYRMENYVSGIELRLENEDDTFSVQERLEELLGPPFIVRSWMDMDRNLVAALGLEKKMMFITLGMIILVACFNICGSLIMMVMEKTRDIGILKAIGANSWGISSVFFLEGFFVGALGIALGGIGGIYIAERVNQILGLVRDLTGWDLFPSDVYYFTELPVKVSYTDISIIIGVAMVLAVAAGLYPGWKASRLDPVEAIRYE